jgi:hypothetical protein
LTFSRLPLLINLYVFQSYGGGGGGGNFGGAW